MDLRTELEKSKRQFGVEKSTRTNITNAERLLLKKRSGESKKAKKRSTSV